MLVHAWIFIGMKATHGSGNQPLTFDNIEAPR